MNLLLNNPHGLWALLGIPAVILIHFLQRKARTLPLSTLFLLEQTQRESLSGRRFERLTNSIPLWLQLLCVLLLTWLLIEPRYKKADSTQQIALVIDSSASMQVIKDKMITYLEKSIPEFQGEASKIDLYLLDSNPSKAPIYAGADLEKALSALRDWLPHAGASDPTQSLQLARSRVRRNGIVAFVTDTPEDSLPFNAQCIALGEKRANCGFTGVSFSEKDGQLIWRVLIRNYSDDPQTRTWTMASVDQSPENATQSAPRTVTIKADGIASIQGPFPTETDRINIKMEADAFALDDVLPLVRPQPKLLVIENQASQKYLKIASKLTTAFPNSTQSTANLKPDCVFASYDPLLPILPEQNAIVVVDETTQSMRYLRGGIIAEKHPLLDGLNWQPLLIRESLQIERFPSDQVLLWQGERPLIFLRSVFASTPETVTETAEGESTVSSANTSEVIGQQLIFNFDLTLSNALRLPATVVLLHRFTNQIRDAKVAAQSLNTETGQILSLAFDRSENAAPLHYQSYDPNGKSLKNEAIPLSQLSQLQAPETAGYYSISQGEGDQKTELLTAAAYFADTREADLRNCAESDQFKNNSLLADANTKAIEKHTYEDNLWRLWILLVLAALLLAWATIKKRTPAEAPVTA